ncbi:hypothetical protein CO657_01480 [Rhizobium acidisoli]|uniref:Uncharacterized protein n=1 Tax=Rhizobium acidisoli TaxID=1538158 RepID=A0AAE5WM93_9HYPH|nr:hypothetical protein CO657_01480 [Rhizobium acidisoli]
MISAMPMCRSSRNGCCRKTAKACRAKVCRGFAATTCVKTKSESASHESSLTRRALTISLGGRP